MKLRFLFALILMFILSSIAEARGPIRNFFNRRAQQRAQACPQYTFRPFLRAATVVVPQQMPSCASGICPVPMKK